MTPFRTPGLTLLLAIAALAACKSGPPAAPAPAGTSAPAVTVLDTPPEPHEQQAPAVYAFVTASALNVRAGAGTDKAKLAESRKGARLQVLSEQGDWTQVRLIDGQEGWVASKYLTKEPPCPPDREPEIRDAPPLAFEPGPSGHVTVEARIGRDGKLAATKVLENTTGDEAKAKDAVADLQQMSFIPPVRKCRAMPFIYRYTKNY